MNTTVQIEASASRALRSFDVRKVCACALSLARRKSLTIAVVCAVALYAGLIAGSPAIICSAAVAAVSFCRIACQTKKGGAK